MGKKKPIHPLPAEAFLANEFICNKSQLGQGNFVVLSRKHSTQVGMCVTGYYITWKKRN